MPLASTEDMQLDLPPTTILKLPESNDGMPESPGLCDDRSTLSSTEHSDTSTLKYDQESWDLYRPRVEQLCQILWPTKKSVGQLLSDSKAVTRMRANRFLRLFVPSQNLPLIERLGGGDFNRIVGITLPFSKTKQDCNRKLVLRVPRWDRGQTGRVVATLDYVRQKSAVPIANVVAKDLGNDNPLGSPYVIQERIPGNDLETLWTDLNHSQRCVMAREVGVVIKSLLKLESSEAGQIQASSMSTGTAGSHTVVPFELKNVDGDLFEEAEEQDSATCIGVILRESQLTIDLFRCQISRWRAVDVARNAGAVERTVGIWDSMLKIVEEMDELSLFTTKLHCLCHVDLHPRNIMAEIHPDSSVQVTGILDWDEAVVAPKFVNCEPPGWLWGFHTDDLPQNSLPTWPYEIPGANDVPSTPEKQELQRIFEEHAGPEYLSLANDEHCCMSRELFRVAVFGLTSSENYNAAERIISDWERLRQSFSRTSS